MRVAILAIVAMLNAGVAAAEPVDRDSPPAPTEAPRQIVLASAEQNRAPSPEAEQAPAPVRRRVGRVTSCRCGDPPPQPEPESPQQ